MNEMPDWLKRELDRENVHDEDFIWGFEKCFELMSDHHKPRPIESAPRDRTILANIDGTWIEVEWEEYRENDWRGKERGVQGEWVPARLSSHGCGCCGDGDTPPTHWLPLPTVEEIG